MEGKPPPTVLFLWLQPTSNFERIAVPKNESMSTGSLYASALPNLNLSPGPVVQLSGEAARGCSSLQAVSTHKGSGGGGGGGSWGHFSNNRFPHITVSIEHLPIVHSKQ